MTTSLLDNTPTSHQAATETPVERAMRTDPGLVASRAGAQKLYPDRTPVVPAAARSAEIQTIRESQADSRQRFLPINAYGVTFSPKTGVLNAEAPLSRLALALNPETSHAALQKNVHELALIARDAGMSVDDVQMLTSAINTLTSKPPTELEVAAGRRRAIAKMRTEYAKTPGGFDQALADAMTVSKRDPMLAKILNTTGANSHEDVILMFAKLGRDARYRGEFSKTK